MPVCPFPCGASRCCSSLIDTPWRSCVTVTQPVQFLQLVWATALGIIVFGEALDPYVIVGGGIVVAAATFISHREAMAARQTTPPAAATKL